MISGAEPELARLRRGARRAGRDDDQRQGIDRRGSSARLGVVGSNGGTLPTRAVVAAADLVVFVGCRAGSVTTERWRYPAPGQVTVIHIDVDPRVIGANYPTAAALIGDAKLTLAALRDALARKSGGWGRDAAAQGEGGEARRVRAARAIGRAADPARADGGDA